MKKTDINISREAFNDLLKKDYKRAFEILFRLYYDKLYHLAGAYTEDPEDAREIVQDVFCKLWQKREDIHRITSSFLYTITRNACLDYLKHRKVVLEQSRDIYDRELSDPVKFVQNEAASEILQQELEHKIRQSIAALPDKQRQVFVKSRFEGMKNREIAEDMGISKRTVDTHIHLAIKFMRFQLREFMTLF
ncbi:RNA polymerase sigma-70 factor [Sinomicrobium soli]|uniref:RNA polymerase sigma-70 factor n=1 Tax=Sinomicrobium sp. N-1-3-6 TaxID=2219864 RepID=UPI000DCDFB11|nr:RNA polymerase sigma-70 factor [Sinomicrobium sp. N-1-3-6]RAV27749.1 RNA polymerase sigma-70 factor [Sinomicrobium sp. N-1-3-6]